MRLRKRRRKDEGRLREFKGEEEEEGKKEEGKICLIIEDYHDLYCSIVSHSLGRKITALNLVEKKIIRRGRSYKY